MVDLSWKAAKTCLLAGVITLVILLAMDFLAPPLHAFHQAHRLPVDLSVWLISAALALVLIWFRQPKTNS